MMITKVDDDMQKKVFVKKGCCFWIPYFGSNSRTTSLSTQQHLCERIRIHKNKKHWWVKGWSKIREWSKLVVIIHGFNKNHSHGYQKQGSFYYDVVSYANNFDDGTRHRRDEDYAYDFSSRYASVPASAKSSMDLGKEGFSFM
ncbi:hypothetical protein VNO78_16268 [Psophocarpus tetragonolobus]|uniref:Uncharacterized protein n=1 Tax=Psophocarpus tetragonolobus TaxID=3891 RepID=A0AAN9SM01_PSOTE